MLDISHYHSLDEILERAAPIDAICPRCKSLSFVDLFSGPRYEDFDEGYEDPRLDVFVATLAEIRTSADKCRICYIMVTFHDAKHMGDRDCKSGSNERVEHCILKPYRTDALLHMKDQSDGSKKETIATSLALVFKHVPRTESDNDCVHRGPSNNKTSGNILTRAYNALLQSSTLFQEDLLCESDNNRVGNDVVFEELPPESVADEADSGSTSQGPWSSSSESSVLETNSATRKLSDNPYYIHNCFFSLAASSSTEHRPVLSLSNSVHGSTIDWRSLRSWLKVCENDHPRCRGDYGSSTPEDGMRIRCIDVETSQIVAVGFGSRYLTLSYVWGAAQSEIPGHAPRSLIKDDSMVITQNLPPTVRDAIKVTKRLRERYLWVDCVCIDQTDKVAIQEQVDIMDKIYENSLLTIITPTNENAQNEIPGMHRNSRLKSSLDALVDGQVIKGMCARSVVGEFYGAWEKRGWTFQEWLLSRRCLFFSNNQILFRCRESSGLESFMPPKSVLGSDISPMPHFWADSRSSLVTLPRLPLGATSWNFQTYAELIKDYTGRNLTYDSDVLHAFTGIMRKLERSCGMSFVEGLPRTDLLRAVLWCPNKMPEQGIQKLRRPERPSWTWSALGCQTTYRCLEVDETPAFTDRYQSVVGPRAPSSARAKIEPSSLGSGSQRSVVLSVGCNISTESIIDHCTAIRYRCASVVLLPETNQLRIRRLLISSETRKLLVHQNPATARAVSTSYFFSSKDNVLHPLTKKLLAGRQFDGPGWRLSLSWLFDVNVGPGGQESFSSHDAILLYEWDIENKNRDWNKEVVAMIVDRLNDGTVERLSLTAIRSEDWYTLPLVSEREDLILV